MEKELTVWPCLLIKQAKDVMIILSARILLVVDVCEVVAAVDFIIV